MPKCVDKINWSLEGCVVKFLSLDDQIQKGDFIRELYESPWLGGGFDSTYKSSDWRGSFWHKVDDDLSGWIGATYRDYCKFAEENEEMAHEIARII